MELYILKAMPGNCTEKTKIKEQKLFLSTVLAYVIFIYFFLKLEERRQNLAATAGWRGPNLSYFSHLDLIQPTRAWPKKLLLFFCESWRMQTRLLLGHRLLLGRCRGQRDRLLLWRSEFESRWSLQFFVKIVVERDENKQNESVVKFKTKSRLKTLMSTFSDCHKILASGKELLLTRKIHK